MLAWITYHWTLFLSYLAAPILFHSQSDGFIFSAVCTILDISDTYGLVITSFSIVAALVYFRNTIFSVYKSSVALFTNDMGYRTNLFNKTSSILSNRTKLLNIKMHRMCKSFFTGVLKGMNKNLNKRWRK